MRNCPKRVSLLIAILSIASVAVAGGKKKEEPETVTETKVIKSETVYTFSRTVDAGRLYKAQAGKDGEVKRTYQVVKKDGKVVSKELVKEERVEAKPTVYHMGRAGYKTNRSGFVRSKVITMKASAYDPGPLSCGKWAAAGLTKLGVKAGYGVAAVDPRFIPLGTLLYVEGYGFAYACDIGSAIKGNRIDLCYESRAKCFEFGRRDVKVHILKAR